MNEEHFEQVRQIIDAHRDYELARVFVPYIGNDWNADDSPRVMICGKATYRWGDGHNDDYGYQDQVERATNFVEQDLVPKSFGSFWHFVWEILHVLLHPNQELPNYFDEACRQNLIGHLYWTNYAKVGGADGNLPNDLLNMYQNQFTEILRAEFRVHQPKLVVITTGNHYAYDAIYGFPGVENWYEGCEACPQLANIEDQNFRHCNYQDPENDSQAKLVWTRHPERWSVQNRRAAVRCISTLHQL